MFLSLMHLNLSGILFLRNFCCHEETARNLYNIGSQNARNSWSCEGKINHLLIIRQKQTFKYTLSGNNSAVEYSLAWSNNQNYFWQSIAFIAKCITIGNVQVVLYNTTLAFKRAFNINKGMIIKSKYIVTQINIFVKTDLAVLQLYHSIANGQ